MNDPTLDRQQPERNTVNARVMSIFFAALCLLTLGGGAIVILISAERGERHAVDAALNLTGPACCSLSGLATAAMTLYALPSRRIAQVALPIVVGVGCGLTASAAVFLFFAVAWPKL